MNKRIIFPVLASVSLLLVWSIQSSFIRPKDKGKTIQWKETTHNFGDIKIGPDAVTTFVFKNKSKKTVTIKRVEPGCSCTVSSFTQDPIKKNKKGSVTATYKTAGRPGFFKKSIKVTFEDDSTAELIITGNVVQVPEL